MYNGSAKSNIYPSRREGKFSKEDKAFVYLEIAKYEFNYRIEFFRLFYSVSVYLVIPINLKKQKKMLTRDLDNNKPCSPR